MAALLLFLNILIKKMKRMPTTALELSCGVYEPHVPVSQKDRIGLNFEKRKKLNSIIAVVAALQDPVSSIQSNIRDKFIKLQFVS